MADTEVFYDAFEVSGCELVLPPEIWQEIKEALKSPDDYYEFEYIDGEEPGTGVVRVSLKGHKNPQKRHQDSV